MHVRIFGTDSCMIPACTHGVSDCFSEAIALSAFVFGP